MIKFHRTVQTDVDTLLDAGLVMHRLLEPQAEPRQLRWRPDLRPPILGLTADRPEVGPATDTE